MKKLSASYTKFIQDLAKIAKSSNLDEIEFKEEDIHIKIVKNRGENSQMISNPIMQNASNTLLPNTLNIDKKLESPQEQDISKSPNTLLSPMVGIVYTSPDPESNDYVSIGDTVSEEDTVLLIEAMKVFNPIKAHKSGKIKEILIVNGQNVEFNEPLLIIE